VQAKRLIEQGEQLLERAQKMALAVTH